MMDDFLVIRYTPAGAFEGMGHCAECGSSLVAAGEDYICLGHLKPEEMLAASIQPEFDEEGDVIGGARMEPCTCCGDKPPKEREFGIDLAGLKKAGFDPELTVAAAKKFGTFIRMSHGSQDSEKRKR